MRITPLILVLGSTLIAAGCNSTADNSPPAATPVRVAAAFDGPAAPAIRTNGLLVNKDEIRLSFKMSGIIKHIGVREGEQVRKGQRLAEIELAEVNAQVEQARQAHIKAQRDLERGERLYADKVISLEQLQDLRTQTAMADAGFASAQFNSNYASIIAPQDGTVLRRLAEVRELVAAGNPIIILGAQNRGFVVRTGLADREIVQIRLGDSAQVQLDALPGATLAGKVTEIAGGADPASGMFMVEVALDAGDLPLKSGLVAKMTLTPATANHGSRVYVPIASIVEGNGSSASVFVLDGGRVQRRKVEVAFIDNEAVALVSGIKSGEPIITDGALYLEDGEQVAVQAPAEAHATSSPAEPSA